MIRENDPRMKFFERASFSSGELSRVRHLTRPSGRALILPYDQFIEHDARHLEAESDAGNPEYILNLGIEGGYNGVAIHYGLAKRYWAQVAGLGLPLIVKVSGKTSIPPGDHPLSVWTGQVEDCVRLGAVAIGYTLYYGSSRQDEDLPQLAELRSECERFGMPLIVWAYPRGVFVDQKGGKDSCYMVESAVRLAIEMGATIVKANLPKASPDLVENDKVPKYFRNVEKDLLALDEKAAYLERARRVVQAGQGIPILFSGGEKGEIEKVVSAAEIEVEAGAFGFIFGRNMWKRKKNEALELTKRVSQLLDS